MSHSAVTSGNLKMYTTELSIYLGRSHMYTVEVKHEYNAKLFEMSKKTNTFPSQGMRLLFSKGKS